MADERFEQHLRRPFGRGELPDGGASGYAGGAACGDLVHIGLRAAGERIVAAGFEAEGCGALIAAASAACERANGAPMLDLARVGTAAIADDLGGLSAAKIHAAELVCDALHQALGRAVLDTAQLQTDPDRVVVAMSGGVDSTVAAALCGPAAIGVTVELWRDAENDGSRSCCSATAVRVARNIAHELGLPHLTLDLRQPFRNDVVAPWLSGHGAGETPNPCILCNGTVRIDRMVEVAGRLGSGTLVTGHYARVTDGLIGAGVDADKDQSYMLAALEPQTITHLRFPLGAMTKPEVRRIARELNLPVADTPDSQDLCFLAGTDRRRFLARHGGLNRRPGNIVDRGGEIVGRHDGHFHFTVGQRRGLGVSGSEPAYVLATDARSNTVTVGPRTALDSDRVRLRGLRLHRDAEIVDGVRLRYRSAAMPCRLEGQVAVLERPFRAPAPGQTAVLLAGDVVVGYGTIVP